MFGVPVRPARPILLGLVFGVFLMIIGVTATVQTVLVSAHFSTATLNSAVAADSAIVRVVVNSFLTESDLAPGGPSPARAAELEGRLQALVRRGQILRLELRRPDGTVVLSDDPAAVGRGAEGTPDFVSAVGGHATVAIGPADGSETVGTALPTSDVLREYFPIEIDGQTRAVAGLWRDAVPVLAELESVRRAVLVVTLAAAVLASLVLYLVFRSAQGRITRQTGELIEAGRRDPLTGTLNHGSLVAALAQAVEAARVEGGAIGVALVDIDNFRLLNETYGHGAGDSALRALVGLLGRELPPEATFGRYGPDELLVIAPPSVVHALRPAVERLRSALVDHALQFDASERLPVTVSAGICTYPENAESVTSLLSAVVITLQEAKASGGDAVRVAGNAMVTSDETRTFDVFQGLVFAVDTKDRYTKRHSEDVSRYAVFLAERAGLDPALVATIRVAGLLHDIGKIGIPDVVLRKPGKLTAEEFEIVKHHVVLGDMIVRDLPNVDEIRRGIRHHHERWDGQGYVDRLAGEGIPLIARVLAVGDAFSAMTTTRPYRKALDVREALRRLEDAAGSQLDERLVGVFVAGIESAPDAPLPGVEVSPTTRIWTPYSRVA